MVNKVLIFALGCLLLSGCQGMQKKLAEKNSLKADYHLDLADNFLRAGKNPAAIEEIQKAINLDPSHPMAHYKMALSLYQRRRLNQSLYHFKQSLLYNSKNTQVRNDLILLLLEQKKYKEAYEHAKISIEDLTYFNPARSYYLKSLAALELQKRDPKFTSEAKMSLINALNYNPKHCGAMYNLGRIYRGSKQAKKAYVLFHRALKTCNQRGDKALALNQLISLSKNFGLKKKWKRFSHLKAELAKQPSE